MVHRLEYIEVRNTCVCTIKVPFGLDRWMCPLTAYSPVSLSQSNQGVSWIASDRLLAVVTANGLHFMIRWNSVATPICIGWIHTMVAVLCRKKQRYLLQNHRSSRRLHRRLGSPVPAQRRVRQMGWVFFCHCALLMCLNLISRCHDYCAANNRGAYDLTNDCSSKLFAI